MKLYVDDIRNAPDESWQVCRTVTAAIRALDTFQYEIKEISLDHDISHLVHIGKTSRPYPCDETFEAVARHIGLMNRHDDVNFSSWEPKITIHTANPIGAQVMEKILRDSGMLAEVRMLGPANRLETEAA